MPGSYVWTHLMLFELLNARELCFGTLDVD